MSTTQEQTLPTFTAPAPENGDDLFARAVDDVISPKKKQKKFAPDIDARIERYSAQHDVDPDLVRRMMTQESGGSQHAVSPKGARSYMQLMPDTARGLGVTNIEDPDQNIEGGVRYLRQQLDEFGDVPRAVAAYNAGPGAVRDHKGIPPYAETQNYVKSITNGYKGNGRGGKPAAGAPNGDALFASAVEGLLKSAPAGRQSPSASIVAAPAATSPEVPSTAQPLPTFDPGAFAQDTVNKWIDTKQAGIDRAYGETMAEAPARHEAEAQAEQHRVAATANARHAQEVAQQSFSRFARDRDVSSDIAWHFGDEGLAKFHMLSEADKQKMVTIALAAAQRDEAKKAAGIEVTRDPAYQAKMRSRIPALQATPSDTAQAPSKFSFNDSAQTAQDKLGIHSDLSRAPDFNPRTGNVEVRETPYWKKVAPGQLSSAQQMEQDLRAYHLPEKSIQHIIESPALAAAVPQPQTSDAQQLIQQHIDNRNVVAQSIAQQWPRFLAHTDELGAKLAKLAGKVVQLPDVTADGSVFKQGVADYLEQRADMWRQVGDYTPSNLTLPAKITRSLINNGYDVGRVMAMMEVSKLPLTTIMVGESLVLNSDKDMATQAKEAAKAYATAWALTKLPQLAQSGLGQVPGLVGKVAVAHPEMVARTIGALGFGTFGAGEAAARGASKSDIVAEGIGTGLVGGVLAGGGLGRIGKDAIRAAIESEVVPEPAKDFLGRVADLGSGLVKSSDGRATSLYADKDTGEVFGNTLTPDEVKNYDPSIVTGSKRNVRNIENLEPEQFDQLMKTLGIKTEAPPKGLPAPDAGTGNTKAGKSGPPDPPVSPADLTAPAEKGSAKTEPSPATPRILQHGELGSVPSQAIDDYIAGGGQSTVSKIQQHFHTGYGDSVALQGEIDRRVAAPVEPLVREGRIKPWQQPYEEFLKANADIYEKSPGDWQRGKAEEDHQRLIEQALTQGKSVPPKVLAGYPNLRTDLQGKPSGSSVIEKPRSASESVIDARDAVGTAILAKPEWKARVLAEMGEGGKRVPFGQETGSGLEFIAATGDRIRVSNARYSDKPPTVGTKASGIVIEREKVAQPSPQVEAVKPAERRAAPRNDESILGWATKTAEQFGGSIEKQGSGYRVEVGDQVAEARTPAEVAQWVRTFSGEAAKTAPKPAEPPTAQPAETIDQLAHDAAHSPTNDLPAPSEAQHEAGNHKKGHINIAGMDLAIENPEGSKREGTDPNGKKWSVTLKSHYGYIKRTTGADEEHIDAYVRPGIDKDYNDRIYVVNQTKANGHFDEHKVMIGWPTEAEARKAYTENYEKGWSNFRDLIRFDNPDAFKKRIADEDNSKPAEPITDIGAPEPESTTVADDPRARYALARKQILAGKGASEEVLSEFPALRKLVKQEAKTSKGTFAPGAEIPLEDLSKAELRQRAKGEGAQAEIYKRELAKRSDERRLGDFVIARGGIRPDKYNANAGELARLGRKEGGFHGVTNKNSRFNAEMMAMDAVEEGYRGDWVTQTMGPHGPEYDVDGNAFLAAIEDDLTDVTPSYAASDIDQESAYRDYLASEMSEHLAEEFANSADAIISMLENDGAAQALNDVYGGATDESKVREFKQLAKGYGVEPEDITAIIAAGRAAAERFSDAFESAQKGETEESNQPDEVAATTEADWQQAKQDLGAGVNAVESMYGEATELVDRILTGQYTDADVEEFHRVAGAFGVSQQDTDAILDAGEEARGPLAKRGNDADVSMITDSAVEFSTEGNSVKLSSESAVRLLNKTLRDIWGEMPYVDGLILTRHQAGAVAARLQAQTGKQAIAMGKAIIEAVASDDHGLVRIGHQGSKLHELFHEYSHKGSGGSPLSRRHTPAGFATMTDMEIWQSGRAFLVSKGYDDNVAILAEEMASWAAEGKYAEMGWARRNAIDFLTAWFQSFIEKNGRVSLGKFKELNNEAAEARDRVYAESGAQQQSDRALPDVSEARQSRNRQELAARARAGEIDADQVSGDAFKKWFGASKAVDAKGKPLVVYHGTPEGDISEFKERSGRGVGIFFTDKTRVAEEYTLRRGMWRSRSNGAAIYPVYLSLQNPLEIDALGKRNDNVPVPWSDWNPKVFGRLPDTSVSVQEIFDYAVEHGHDGVIIRNVVDTADVTDKDKSTVYAAVKPSQIKSAIGNRGTFDPEGSNILAKIGDKPDPKKALFSALYKARNKPVPAKFEQQSLFDVPQEAAAKPTTPKRMVEAPTAERNYGTIESPNVVDLSQDFAEDFLGNISYPTITAARNAASHLIVGESGKIESGTQAAKAVDEAIELGVVRRARDVVKGKGSEAEKFDALVELLGLQPTLGTRTSTSVRDQAYSTPIPLAYVASRLAEIDKSDKVGEPAAGNGALLIEATERNITANELNNARNSNLRAIYPGADTIKRVDATDFPLAPVKTLDVVIANPPFGAAYDPLQGGVKTYKPDPDNPRYVTNEIDHAISLKALESMKDDGRAVLIVGSVKSETPEGRSDGYNGKSKREFYKTLYDKYNVVDHFTATGDLYRKQGAAWPVDVIVIHGRGKSSLRLPAADVPRTYNTWDELKGVLNATYRMGATAGADVANAEPEPAVTGDSRGGVRKAGPEAGSGDLFQSLERPSELDAGQGGRSGAGTARPVRGVAGKRPGSGVDANAGERGERPDFLERPDEGALGPDGNTGRVAESGERSRPARRSAGQPDVAGGVGLGTAGAAYRSGSGERSDLTSSQAPYRPASKAAGLNTLVPTNMRNSIEESLARLMEREGPVDSYVARELDYNPEELTNHFSAEQIDAAALALASIERDEGFIIGDQGGIGKGRVVAAIIKYARLQGRTAIFVTEKPNLYKDIVRDLVDIGEGRIADWSRRAVMTNGAQTVPLDDEQTAFLKTPTARAHNDKLSQMIADDDLHGHEAVFTTYAQMQTLKGEETERRQFLRHFANGAIIIFDESHNAGGSENKTPKKKAGKELPPDRAQFAREISRLAHGVFYSSATYAKRPSVMDLYSKTDMHKAVESFDKLIEAFTKGGIPLQQVVASMLAEAGQYIRRERDLSGLTYATHEIKVDKQKAEDMAAVMRRIREFDELVEEAIDEVKNDLKEAGSTVLADGSVRTPGVNSTNFTAIMHNLIDQMLLMVKADGVVEKALEVLKAGEKPVITVSNTMGAFIHQYAEDNDLNTGDAIALNFGDMLKRYLERSREIVIGKAFGDKERVRLTDEQIGAAAVDHFDETRKQIESMNWEGLHMSPIDYIKNRLAQAGYKIGEITGRGHVIDYSGRKPVYRTRPGREISIAGRIQTLTHFNNGTLHGLIMNQAGSTGLSIHASSKFRDQSPRHMLIAQAEKNIDTHMQLLYRVDRTGQVVKPTYSQIVANIPAENRPAAVLSKKMASLNANTTADRGSAYEAKNMPDFMNDYGDEVAATLMEDNPDLHAVLGKPLKESEQHDGFERDGAMRKVTGRIPLLPVAQQEDFYEVLMNEYNDFIQRLDAMGENALEAKTMDLDAKQIASTKVFEGKGPSPFEQGAMAEEMDVKRVGKPFTKEQVLTQLREALGAPEASLPALEKKGDEEQFKAVLDMRKEFAVYKREYLNDLKTADRRAANDTKLQEIMDKWADIRRTVHVGASVKLVSAFGINYGMVTKVERKGSPKNPAALGAWRVTFAVADAMKQLVMPFSKVTVGEPSSIGEAYHSIAVRRIKEAEVFDRKEAKWVTVPIIEAFERRQTESREMRTIITGNLLAGFGQFGRGRIINFTDDEGQLRQGIMMPQDFDVRKELQKQAVKFSKAEQVVRFLGEGLANARVVESADKELRLTAVNGGKYRLTVPAARARGGQYYLNDKVLKAANNEFVKSGNVMQMTVSEPAAKAAVQALLDSDVVLVTNSYKEEAAKIIGVNLITGKSVSVPKGQAGSVGIGALLGSSGASAEDARDTFSFIDSLKTRVLLGGSQLRAASQKGYEAFAQAAGTRARAQVVSITAKQQIQRALGGGAQAYDKFLAALTESRLRGVRDRWLEMADGVRGSVDDDLKESYPGLRGILARIFDHPMFDQENEQLGDLLTYADSLAAADHWTPLRNFIAAAFELAADNVASIEWEGNNDWFDDYVASDRFQSALPIYKRLVERPLAESHAENEGVFSNALGPLNTYAPLVPVKDDGSLLRRVARGSFKPYKRPENIHNRMATGLSERYELNAGNLAESVAKAFWTNDKAHLLQVLEDEGLILPLKLGQAYERAIEFKGVHYKADPVSITDPKVLFKDGKVVHVGGKMALVPRFIKRELKPILDGDFSDGSANALVSAINMIGMAGPLDAVFHTNNVIGALVAGTPWTGTDLLSKTIGNTPATKMVAALVNIIRTDPLDERGLEELQELAKLGILPDRWGSVAFRRSFAREIGAKWRPSFAPVLYGAKGLDARARLLMYRIAKQMNPNASNDELIQFIGQMGVYNRAMQSEIERWLKRWGVSPFYTAGMTMLRNGVRLWTGRNLMPLAGVGSEREIKDAFGRAIQLKQVGTNRDGDPQYGVPKGRAAWWRLAQQLSGGVLGLLGLWFLLHKLERGKYPWEENDSRLLQIKLNQKHRQTAIAKRIYGADDSGAYVGLGFLSPMVERGARAIGAAGAYETAYQGGTPGQIAERAERDVVNSLAHPFTSGPAFRGAFVFATGDEPYLSQTRDQYGQFGPQLRPAIGKTMPGLDTYKARAREGFLTWNNFNQKFAAEMFGVGHQAEENEKRDDAGGWLRMALDLAVPRLIKGTYNRDKQARGLKRQIDAVEPDVVKQLQSRDVHGAADFYRHADDSLKPKLLPALLRKVQIAAPGTIGEDGYDALKEAGVTNALQAIDKRRPVEKELERLNLKFPQTERHVLVEGLPRRLSDEQYEGYQARANELFYDRLPRMFERSEYKSASNTIKEGMIRDIENNARALATAEVRTTLVPEDRRVQLEAKKAALEDRVHGDNPRLLRLKRERQDKMLRLRYKVGPPL